MSKIVSWLKDVFCNIPTLEITPEKENEMIERIVEKISKYDLEIPTIFLGSGFQSTSTVLSHMVLPKLPEGMADTPNQRGEKGVGSNSARRPEGRFAQIRPTPFFPSFPDLFFPYFRSTGAIIGPSAADSQPCAGPQVPRDAERFREFGGCSTATVISMVEAAKTAPTRPNAKGGKRCPADKPSKQLC